MQKNGAGIYTADGTQVSLGTGALVTGNTVVITNNTYGGGVFVGAGTTFTLNGGIISGNRAYNGGGVGVESGNSSIPQGGSFVMNSGSIRSNTATSGGGIMGFSSAAVYTGSTATITINGGTIGGSGTPNTATSWGGGVCMSGGGFMHGIFTMSGGEISYNLATPANETNGDGGGGVVINGANDSISGGSIHHNNASFWGGGILKGNGTLTISGTASISENTSGWYGGGICVKPGGTITMNGGSISGNKIDCTRNWPEGGGVYLSALNGAIPGGVFILNNGSISGNSVKTTSNGGLGGGIWKDAGATLTMNGGSISGNSVLGPTGTTSQASGGAVYVRGAGAFIFNGGVVSGNTSNHPSNKLKGLTIETNTTFEMGGTALVHANNDVYLEANAKIRARSTLTSSAVATITVADATTAGAQIITLLDSGGNTITSNKAVTDRFTIDKSGLSISDTGYLFMVRYVKGSGTRTTMNGLTPETAYATLYAALSEATFKGNISTPIKQVIVLDTLYNDKGGNTTANGSFVLDGTAIGTAWVAITGGTLDSRNQNLSGSGKRVVNIDNGAKVKFENITITSGGESGSRGAVCVSAATTSVTFGTGAKVTDYVSSEVGQGGGVAINAGTVVLDGGEISDCHAGSKSGGGVYIDAGTITMKNGSKIENCSANKGGGVYVNGGTFNMTGGTISGNNAAEGAGIYAFNPITLSGGTISGNTASSHGGGIYVAATTAASTMINTVIENNTSATNGGGIFMNMAGQVFVMNGGIIRNNSAASGCGVYAYNGSFSFYNGNIYGNKIGSVIQTGQAQGAASSSGSLSTASSAHWTE